MRGSEASRLGVEVEPRIVRALLSLVTSPARDYMQALENSLSGDRIRGFIVLSLALAVSWWLYVPVHELMHVAGCVLTGGTVTRLDLEPIYGAHVLAQVFPFISPGSDYAGQLSGFDTKGSDLIYLATDAAPFVLSVFVGIPLVCRVALSPQVGVRNAVTFGASLPFAYAPLLSVAGDYYEMSSILLSRVAHSFDPTFDPTRWRGDDFQRVVEQLQARGALTTADALGLALGMLFSLVLVLLTFKLGRSMGHVLATPEVRVGG